MESTLVFQNHGLEGVVIAALVIIAATIAIAELLARLAGRAITRASDGAVGGTIFSNIIRACVWVAGLCLLLRICFAIDASVLWGALGIGGIAVSLGLQNTVSNLIGGLQVSLSRDVAIGDWVQVGAVEGEVKDITWRYMLVTDENGCDSFVPNSVLNTTTLTRMPPYQRVPLPLLLESGSDLPDAADDICKLACAALDEKNVRAPEMPKPALSIGGTQLGGTTATLVCYARRSFTTGQVADAAMSAVMPYLDERGLLHSADGQDASGAVQ